jgi:protocatechuate 3,4-dioxygenase beta subunit
MRVTRRELMRNVLGGLGAAVLLGGCGDSAEAAGGTCTVYPRQTAGPFYLDQGSVRRDVTEGRPGTPLRLGLLVVGGPACLPLADVAVDLWQCDAAGVYSGFPGQLGGLDTTGERFLRGTQVTGEDGRVTFETIYPGWYPGRTTHIHFRLHLPGSTEATSQLYFPEEVSRAVYATGVYAARGNKDTSNAADGVNRGSVPPLVAVTGGPGAYVGELRVVVASS